MSVYWSCRCYWPVDLFFPLRFAYTQNQHWRRTAEMASLHCCLIQKSRYKSPFVPFRFYCNRSSSLFGSWCLVKERSNDTHAQHPKKILYVCFFLQNHRLPICLTFQQQLPLPSSIIEHRMLYVPTFFRVMNCEWWSIKAYLIFAPIELWNKKSPLNLLPMAFQNAIFHKWVPLLTYGCK